MRAPRRTLGFTFIEALMAVLLMALLTYYTWDVFVGGMKQVDTASDHLSAMQYALLLMEMIQEDVRQISVLNSRNGSNPYPIRPFSLIFSRHGKSFRLRKSTEVDPSGSRLGSSFTIVTYQLVEHPTMNGLFNIKREERTATGHPLPGSSGESEEIRTIRHMLISDVRFDFLARIENMSTRLFMRVSLTTVNEKAVQSEPRIYYISNMFELTTPEMPNNPVNTLSQIAIGEPFHKSGKWDDKLAPGNIVAGEGNLEPLAAPEDYLTRTGGPPGPTVKWAQDLMPKRDPFERPTGGYKPIRSAFLGSAVDGLERILGFDFRGAILGEIPSPDVLASGEREWIVSFSLDASPTATRPLMIQLNSVLDETIAHGPRAVAEMGHWFMVSGMPGVPMGMTTAVAARLIAE